VIRRGDAWGVPSAAPPDAVVAGDDADLAAAVSSRPGVRVAFDPTSRSDVARTVGLSGAAAAGTTDLPFDAIDLDDGSVVVNAVVLGVAPDHLRRRHRGTPVVVRIDGRTVFDGHATTVVIATGQYLRSADLVPRGHPGDGRIEVQIYALAARQRAAMRRRLATGTHVPHPEITEASGRHVAVSAADAWPVELDGRRARARSGLTATVRPAAWSLVV
jgi:diacylglycerol kinase family enzyme